MAFSDAQKDKILQFYMESLPESDLARLDAILTGEAPAPAQDARRAQFMALDSMGRHSLRKRGQKLAQDAAAAGETLDKMFPDNSRLGASIGHHD